MNTDKYLPTLHEFFAQLPSSGITLDELTLDTPILATGVLDSLNLFLLISHIEDELGIDIDPDDVTPESFASLRTICDLMTRSSKVTAQ